MNTTRSIQPPGLVSGLLLFALIAPLPSGAQLIPPAQDASHPAPPLLLRSPDTEVDPHAGHDHSTPGATDNGPLEALISLDPDIQTKMGIRISTAGPAVLQQHLVLPGEVQVNGDRLAHIVPRYAGLVTEVRKHMGDRVERGEALAVVESNESLATYEIKSLLAGTVIDKHVTIGETISDDAEVYTVADLSTVWVDLTIFQRDLASVRTGQRVTVMSDSGTASGTLAYISPTLHPQTRTALARVVLSNETGRWKPGMFVTGRLAMDAQGVEVAIPENAVQMLDGEPVVFVPAGKGFAPVPVRTGQRGFGLLEIQGGLQAGDQYVSSGAFHLKAEIVTSGLDPHAGHGH